MDIMNIFTAITWTCIGSSILHSMFPYNVVYYSSCGILFYYIFKKTEEMDLMYIKYGNGSNCI